MRLNTKTQAKAKKLQMWNWNKNTFCLTTNWRRVLRSGLVISSGSLSICVCRKFYRAAAYDGCHKVKGPIFARNAVSLLPYWHRWIEEWMQGIASRDPLPLRPLDLRTRSRKCWDDQKAIRLVLTAIIDHFAIVTYSDVLWATFCKNSSTFGKYESGTQWEHYGSERQSIIHLCSQGV